MGPSKHRLVKESEYVYEVKYKDYKAILVRSYNYDGRYKVYEEVTWMWDSDLGIPCYSDGIIEKLLEKVGMDINDMYMHSCNTWKVFVRGESHKFENY